jgi:predicted Zn-dependent protease with MMP-like domain
MGGIEGENMVPEAGERYDRLLDQAHEALTEDECERAIELAREAIEIQPDDFEGYFVAGVAFHELGDYRRALDYLRQSAALSPDDPLVKTYEARVRFFLGEEEEAEKMLRWAVKKDPELADAYYWLSMVVERRGRYAEADEFLAACARLDPERYPRPCRMTRAELERDLNQVVKELPPPIAGAVGELTMLIEDLPSRELLADGDDRLAPDILGLFVGTSLREASVWGHPHEPNIVYLFKRNLERVATSRDELIEEARVTLIHEIGHYLGLDEEDLAERGLD